MKTSAIETKEYIKNKYGEIASHTTNRHEKSEDRRTLIPLNIINSSMILGYSETDLSDIPQSSNMGLGCGNPIFAANLKEGEVVLDLGSGGGIDCFLARKKVGDSGYVIGVDMTPEMITLANNNKSISKITNIEFRLGEIEHLPIENDSVDVILSNCVVNLSQDKEQVFKEAYRVLKPNGRICISDILATAELPPEIKGDLARMAGCVAGAEYVGTLREMLERVGFCDIHLQPKDNSKQILTTWSSANDLSDVVASYLIKAIKR